MDNNHQQLITQILTNGVSFELVVGACCVVVFSNSLSSGSSASSCTININSTGAKKFKSYSKSSLANSSTLWGTSYLTYGYPPLFVYNGSTYMVQITMPYGDYQD